MLRRFTILLAALALAACDSAVIVNDGGEVIQGSGNAKTETRPVAQFTAIRVSSVAEVVIERTGAETLTVTGDDNLLSLFISEVKDGTLSLSVAKGKSFKSKKVPAYRITVGDLRKVELGGSGEVSASKLEGAALSISVSGSGTLNVAGQVDDLAASVSGSGTVDAAGLNAKRAKVVVSGSGDATVNASDELDARVSGSGSIRYLGAPKLTSNVSGSGSIRKK